MTVVFLLLRLHNFMEGSLDARVDYEPQVVAARQYSYVGLGCVCVFSASRQRFGIDQYCV